MLDLSDGVSEIFEEAQARGSSFEGPLNPNWYWRPKRRLRKRTYEVRPLPFVMSCVHCRKGCHSLAHAKQCKGPHHWTFGRREPVTQAGRARSLRRLQERFARALTMPVIARPGPLPFPMSCLICRGGCHSIAHTYSCKGALPVLSGDCGKVIETARRALLAGAAPAE